MQVNKKQKYLVLGYNFQLEYIKGGKRVIKRIKEFYFFYE